jgi:N utilization substance protein A
MGYSEEDVSGRCACILANGKRCPNASLPGSRYCGLPAHQALEGTGTDYLVPPEEGAGEGDEAGADGELAASGNGEVPAAELEGEAGEVAIEEAPVEDAPVEEAVIEDAPVEDAPVEDSAAADQPLDEEPVPEAEPVAEDEPADAEGEVAVAEDEPLADDEPAEEESAASANEETPAEEAEES